MANKNFEVKHGLSVGGTERITSAGVGTFTDLNVTGTTTTIDTATLQVQDKNIVINYGSGDTSSTASGAGITIQDAVDASNDATLLWDASADEFDFSHTVTAPSLKSTGASTFDSTLTSTGIGLNANTSMYTQDASLSYYSSSNAVYLNGAGADGWLRLNASGQANDRTAINLFGQNQGDIITFKTATNEVARITSNGNVGIGNASPNAFLSVRKDNNNSGNQFVVADTEGATPGVRTYTHNGDDSGLILNHYYAVGGSGNEYMRYADFVANVGSGAGTTMRFITKNAANTFTVGLVQDNNGNIGIGETSPDKQLHIKNTATGDTGIVIENTNNAQNLDIDFYNNVGSAQGRIRYAEGAGSFDINPNVSGTSPFTILYDGKVGISNASPGALLHVGGDGISLNSTTDVSRTSIFRTTGTGNYSSSGNNSAAHAATFMRGDAANTGDQIGHSYVFNNGGWSATAEIMAEVEDNSTAYSRLNFKTWRGGMATRQVITSEGYVVKAYQPYIRCAGNTASMAANQGTTADYSNWADQAQRGITRSGATFTVPIAGEYLITYSFYNWINNSGPNVTHAAYLQKNGSTIQETVAEYDFCLLYTSPSPLY